MKQYSRSRLVVITALTAAFASLFWTFLFHDHAVMGGLTWEINTIFFSVIAFYLLLKAVFTPKAIDLIKIYIRLIFRVWLLIFITFSMYQGEQRVGFLLSLSFIFGYEEGLIDIENWLRNHDAKHRFSLVVQQHKTLASLFIISVIHFTCAIILWLFFRYY